MWIFRYKTRMPLCAFALREGKYKSGKWFSTGFMLPTHSAPGTLGNTWSHFWLSWLWAVRCYWHSRGQRSGMLFTSHSVQQKPSTKKRNPFSVSVVQRSRNHEIDNRLRIRGHFFPQNQKLNKQTNKTLKSTSKPSPAACQVDYAPWPSGDLLQDERAV